MCFNKMGEPYGRCRVNWTTMDLIYVLITLTKKIIFKIHFLSRIFLSELEFKEYVKLGILIFLLIFIANISQRNTYPYPFPSY